MSRIKPRHLVGTRSQIRTERAIRRLARGLRGGITSPSRPWHRLFLDLPAAELSLAKDVMRLHEARMAQRTLNFNTSWFGFKPLGSLPLRESDFTLEAPGVTDPRLADWLADTKAKMVSVYNLCLKD